MNRIVDALSTRRKAAGVLACLYFVVLTLAHDLMQQPAYWAQGTLSHRTWNTLVTVVGGSMGLVLCIWIATGIRRHQRRTLAAFYFLVTVALAVAAFRTLLVMNIEIVHFPQYAILAVLLFSITRRYSDTIALATIGGVLDEAYQYFVLYADRWIHFDFNDAILNAIGAGLGLVLVFVFVQRESGDRCYARLRLERLHSKGGGTPLSNPLAKGATRGVARHVLRESALGKLLFTPVFVAFAAFITVSTVAYRIGWIRLLQDDDAPSWAIVLRRGGPSTMYWTPTDWGKTYHEVGPGEWLSAALLLVALYAALDLIDSSRRRIGLLRNEVPPLGSQNDRA